MAKLRAVERTTGPEETGELGPKSLRGFFRLIKEPITEPITEPIREPSPVDITVRSCMQKVRNDFRGDLIVPYQQDGVAWMLWRELDAIPGGLLCDEMGLGKTVQTIGTMIRNPVRHTLIVAPKAVVSQWVEAFAKFMGVTPLIVIAKEVHANKITAKNFAPHSVIITTYSTFASVDKEESIRLNPFHDFAFGRVVLDEAHAIKNRKTRVHKQILRIQSRIRWGLTGTPISKNLGDFSSLLSFLGVTAQSKQDLVGLRHKYMKRRTKEDLCNISARLRLPACEVRLVTSPFRSQEERDQYEELKEGLLRVKAMAAGAGGKDNSFHILEAILRLRQCVVNPAVLQDGLYRKEVKEALENKAVAPPPPAPWQGRATKLEMLVEEIAKQPKAEKTLIFCHWSREMDAVQEALSEKLGLLSVRLDGSMSIEQRNWAIEQFTNSPDVNMFIIQIDCGGIGLNLQMATRVYINSLHWNASNELQAISRAHRTGQNNKVTVTRLVIEETIDEYFIKTQDGKLKITSETLNDPHIRNQLMDTHGKTMTLVAKDMLTIFK